MFLLLRKASLWAALFGVVIVVFMVRKTTAVEPMPELASAPAQKPSARVVVAAGIVEALGENTSVGVPVSALVKAVFASVWDRVETGAPLLQLDDRELQAQLQTQEADLRVREAELAKARRQHERTEALRAGQVVSRDEADTRHDEFIVARARVDAARATVEQTKGSIERLTVRAPIGGTVLQVNTRAGESVTQGAETAPILLGAIEEVQVRADVDEQLAPRIRPGSKAIGYLKGDTQHAFAMEFVRLEPFVTPKRNLTGSSSERVDTRVLQVIYRAPIGLSRRIYVGQQMDVFIEE